MRLTPVGKIVSLLVVIGLAVGIWRSGIWSKLAPAAAPKDTVVPKVGELPSQSSVPSVPSTTQVSTGDEGGCTDKPAVRLLGYAWNAQMGMHLANGGPSAARGSIMCRHGVNLKFSRQDDNAKLQEALISFATDLSRGNPNPQSGAHFMTMMGDGSAAFLAGLNKALNRIGPDYQAKIVGAIGYSRGEDKFMGPAQWKFDPQSSKGGVVAGVLRDGDWNIAMKWLSDNGLKTNPDEKTYDPDALNWISANDYLDACEKYINGYTETREVVRNGQKTGEKKTIHVDAVVTWTPGDVNIAQKKGGLTSIISTKEYSSQMPCVVIGIDKWMRQNRGTVDNMLAAIAEGGDLVKTNPAALQKAAQVSAQVYNEKDAGYWAKYYKGTTEVDKQNLSVELGGSSVNNLADSLLAFGLVPGSQNLVAATYTVFGDVVKSQYPEMVPTYPSAGSVIDTSYMSDLQKRSSLSPAVIAQVKPKFKPASGGRPARMISKRNWSINFNPNSANFTPQAKAVMEQLTRELLVAGNTSVEVHGHTDNQGNNPGKSMTLSKARALSVKNWLEHRAPVNFPQGRIQAMWHGESQPLVRANNPQAWAKNRRVEIVLRSAG